MLWLCVELPALQLEVCARGAVDPAQPMVLVENNRVSYLNSAAAQCGILVGSSLATASSLCHRLRHFTRNPSLEQERLRLLAAAAYRFSDCVSLHDATAADRPAVLLLEVSGSLKLFGGLYALKRQVGSLFTELGHLSNLGIGHTPLAALALARSQMSIELSRWPSPARVQSICFKALRELPLRFTELDAALIERLDSMGITVLGHLLRLPTASLGHRFGTRLLDYLDRLSGQQPDPRIQFAPPPRFETTLHLLDSISNRQVLLFPMQRLLRDLEHWLVARQLGVTRIGWTLASFDGTSVRVDLEFTEPVQRQDTLLTMSRLKLDAGDLPAEIVSLSLSARRLVPWTEAGRAALASLFHRPGRSGESPLALVDRFRARLGATACHGIAGHDDVRPEHAWKAVQPDPKPPPKASSPKTSPKVSCALPRQPARTAPPAARPLWLLTKPIPVKVRHLTLLHGPERIESGWWDTADPATVFRRDYYVARHTNGTTCWVFSESEDRWFVHGCFA